MFKEVNRIPNLLIWSGQNKARPAYIRYGLPVVLVFAATLLKLQFITYINTNSPYLLYFGIVCLCTILAGPGPAILATLLSLIVADYYFMPPAGQFLLTSTAIFRSIVFLIECTFLILLCSAVTSAYQRVKQNQLLFRAMIEQGSEGIVLTNSAGRRIYASTSIERLIGYTADEFLKMEPWILSHPEEVSEMKAKMEWLMKNPGKSISFVHRIRHKDGRWIWLENSITNLLDNGAVKAVVANFHNVTERILLEQKKDDFITIASHELKTPVTSLKASLQLLERVKDGHKPELMPKLISQANRSADRITGLIDDLLNASRIGQGQLHLNKTDFVMAGLLAACCSHVREAGRHNLILQGDMGASVYADESRIDQVIVNMVNNAVKYAPGSKDIIMDIQKTGGYVKVSVTDKGPGIPREKQSFIFDRYYRADQVPHNNAGLGLGLYICSEIVKRHGGQIGVESDPGQGSTFWFTLPASA